MVTPSLHQKQAGLSKAGLSPTCPPISSGSRRSLSKLDYGKVFLRFIQMADVKPGEKILDIAFNVSSLALQMLRLIEPGGKLICIAFTDEMLERARAEARLFGLAIERKIEWQVVSSGRLPFDDSQFDLVTCMVGFRHLNCERMAVEAYRVLNRGGRFVTCELALQGSPLDPLILKARRLLYRYLLRNRGEAEARLYSADALGEMIHAVGFRQVFIRGLERPAFGCFPALSIVRAIK